MSAWHCVEGDCRAPAAVWLTFTVEGKELSWPFCKQHMDTVIARARRRRPGVPIKDERHNGKRWS